MKVRFSVDRKAATAARINTTTGVVTLDVDPQQLSEADAAALAARLSECSERDGAPGCMNVMRQSESGGYYTGPSLVVKSPTLAGLLQAMADNTAEVEKARRQKAEYEEAEQRRMHAAALECLQKRKTRRYSGYEFRDGPGAGASFTAILPDWPYVLDAVTELPEAQAWLAELEAANRERAVAALAAQEAKKAAEAEQKRRKEEAEAKARAEMAEWVAAHGSARLKRCLAEGINCESAYRDERLALERPGWRWSGACPGEYDDPRNPSDADFALLDEARKMAPDASLVYWTVEHEHDEDGGCVYDGDCPKYDYAGCVAVAQFLGREVVFGLPDDVSK